MKEDVYIFIGSSGAGKGTQSNLLHKKLGGLFPNAEIFYLETGVKFRELMKENTFTAIHTRKMMEDGELPPAFLGVHTWSHELIFKYNESQKVIIDGTPRVASEVPLLISAFEYYGWRPHVINIKVSDQWSFEHLKLRGRADDLDDAGIKERIEWFHTSVTPALDILKKADNVLFHEIDGEHTIEEVHEEICRALNL